MNRTNENTGRQPGADNTIANKTHDFNNTEISIFKQYVKRIIVTAACWELIPFKLATFLIQKGGMRDA